MSRMTELAHDKLLLQWCSTVWAAEILQCRVHSDNWLWMKKGSRHKEWMCNMPCKSSSAECNAQRTVKPQWLTSDFSQLALQDAVLIKTQVRRKGEHQKIIMTSYAYSTVWSCDFNTEVWPFWKITIIRQKMEQDTRRNEHTLIIYTTLPMME